MKNKIKEVDFTHTSPGFLLEGQDKVKTLFGGSVSVLTILVLAIFFGNNLISMLNYEQDTYNSYID
jgi:hypothetical protein